MCSAYNATAGSGQCVVLTMQCVVLTMQLLGVANVLCLQCNCWEWPMCSAYNTTAGSGQCVVLEDIWPTGYYSINSTQCDTSRLMAHRDRSVGVTPTTTTSTPSALTSLTPTRSSGGSGRSPSAAGPPAASSCRPSLSSRCRYSRGQWRSPPCIPASA